MGAVLRKREFMMSSGLDTPHATAGARKRPRVLTLNAGTIGVKANLLSAARLVLQLATEGRVPRANAGGASRAGARSQTTPSSSRRHSDPRRRASALGEKSLRTTRRRRAMVSATDDYVLPPSTIRTRRLSPHRGFCER